MTTHTIHEGTSQATGITTRAHFEDESIVIQKTFDAEPHVEYAKRAREATQGQRWGEGKLIGHIPPAFYAQTMLIRDPQEREKAVLRFFQENPAFVMFDKALK
jgi:hypothetical protein